MLNEHDQDVLLRCPRLGHEVSFGYCRQETRGKSCRLILNCWWEQFDVRSFLQANLPEADMAQVERFPDRFGHLAHGHFAHEQQREGFKLLWEMCAQSFPRRTHPEHVAARPTFAAGQPAGDLAAGLENIEVPPSQHFGMVIAENQPALFGTARQLSQLGHLANLQNMVPLSRSNRLSVTSQLKPNPSSS